MPRIDIDRGVPGAVRLKVERVVLRDCCLVEQRDMRRPAQEPTRARRYPWTAKTLLEI